MKTKNSDIAVKIFLVVVAVILVGLIIAWSTGVFRDKRKNLNEGTERINKAISAMAEFDLLAYDGGSITGELLLELIKKSQKNDLGFDIEVETSMMTTPAAYPTEAPKRSDNNYINPNGIFVGEVTRNDNEIIERITFRQKKN